MSLPRSYRAQDMPACAKEFTASAPGRVVADVELAGGDVSVLNARAADHAVATAGMTMP